MTTSYRPDLPDWGMFPRPPEAGLDWVHPDDVELAQKWIPSARIFRRSKWDGEYYWLHYGPHVLRLRPSLWTPTPPVDLEVDQQVELLARQGANDAGIFRISEILFNEGQHQIEFYLKRDELILSRAFEREDLQPLHEHHELRTGFYEHETPKLAAPDDLDTLDVGNLLDE